MVAFPPTRPAPRNRRKLIAVLAKVADDLLALRAEVRGVLEASGRKGDLSAAALKALAHLSVQGHERLAARMTALGGPPAAPGGPNVVPATLATFLQTYRRCGRRLCLALSEAREAGDTATVDVVFHLLRDLERQLWLLDGGRGGVPFESMAAPAVYQFC